MTDNNESDIRGGDSQTFGSVARIELELQKAAHDAFAVHPSYTYEPALAQANSIYRLVVVPESNAVDIEKVARFSHYTNELLLNLKLHVRPMLDPDAPIHFLTWHFMAKYKKPGDASLVKMAYSLHEFLNSDFQTLGAAETRAYQKAIDAKDFFAMLNHTDTETLSSIAGLMHELNGMLEKLESKTRLDVLEFAARKDGLDAREEHVAMAKKILLMALEETSANLAPLLEDFMFAVDLAKIFEKRQPDMKTLIRILNEAWEHGNVADVWLSKIAKHAKSPAIKEFALMHHQGRQVEIGLVALAKETGIPAPDKKTMRKIIVRGKIPT